VAKERICEIAAFIPTRSALACQSLALIAESSATLLAVLTFLLAKNWPVTPSVSGEKAG